MTFAVQSELTWIDFLRDAVVPLIRAKLTPELVKLMTGQLRFAAGEGKGECILLVDGIMKVE